MLRAPGDIPAAKIPASGRAAIFIPFGRATDSHQLRNAQEMVNANAGKLISEPELTPQRLADEIFSLLDHPEQIEQLSSRARALGKPNAARDIVDLVEAATGVLPKRQGESS